MKKILFFVGKGGVGKSTVSTATALQLAETGKHVLLVSLDQAHNVGDILGRTVGDKPKTVSPNLDVAESDLKKWVKKYLQKTRQDMQSQYRYNVTLNLDHYINIMKHSPGTEEYAVLWAIEHYVHEYANSHDLIIFDTPPTALTLRIFAMPSVTRLWIKELRKMRKKILAGRRTINRLNPDNVPVKGALDEDKDAVYGHLGLLDDRVERMMAILTQESYISVVINNDRLSIAESERIKSELSELAIPLNSFCLNKLASKDEDTSKIDTVLKSVAHFRIIPSDEGVDTQDALIHVDLGGLDRDILTTEN